MAIYIKHHGVKGMKWGVRKDVLKESSKILKDASTIGNGTKSKTVNKKDYSKMSDEELKKRVNRLNLENQLANLTGDAKKVRSGADWVRDILQGTGVALGVAASAITIYMAINGIKK